MELEEASVPDVTEWNDTFTNMDELITYHNDIATKHFYFYLLDKTKFITYGEILDSLNDERKQTLEVIVDKNKKLEYSFSLYCFQYDKHNAAGFCKSHMNFVLCRNEVNFDELGQIKDLKYRKTSYNNVHTFSFKKRF